MMLKMLTCMLLRKSIRDPDATHGGSRNALLGSVETVGKMATVRQIETHDTVVRPNCNREKGVCQLCSPQGTCALLHA
jgi:hypothetical protein